MTLSDWPLFGLGKNGPFSPLKGFESEANEMMESILNLWLHLSTAFFLIIPFLFLTPTPSLSPGSSDLGLQGINDEQQHDLHCRRLDTFIGLARTQGPSLITDNFPWPMIGVSPKSPCSC